MLVRPDAAIRDHGSGSRKKEVEEVDAPSCAEVFMMEERGLAGPAWYRACSRRRARGVRARLPGKELSLC